MSANLHLNIDGSVANITMDNPPANTWTDKTLVQLKTLIEQLNAHSAVQALVISGAGEKFFSAGADLKIFAEADEGEAWKMATLFGDAFEALSHFRGVSIAAINGYAMGGGLEVALACDLRLCTPTSKMALPEAKVGLLPCAGGTQNLTAIVGEGWAKRMILCGEMVDAERAEKIGLVEQVVEADELLNEAQRLAESVANQSPTSVNYCKQLIQMGRAMPRAQALIQERELFVKLWQDNNRHEGCHAFLEKRKPGWQ